MPFDGSTRRVRAAAEAAVGKHVASSAGTWRRPIVGCLLLMMATSLVGCGTSAESTVSGAVTLDGVALDHGQVVFVPTGSGGQGVTGQIQSDGSYRMQVGQTGGLQAGEYKVVVLARAPALTSSTPGAPPAPGKLVTPARYGNAATTDLQFVVEPGGNTINLELASK
jgi:hypothetical protein